MTTGEKLTKLRKENKYTQEQLADILDVSRQAVSRWETDLDKQRKDYYNKNGDRLVTFCPDRLFAKNGHGNRTDDRMENTTKERILDEALISFAENGYKGTNLRELAAELRLSKSALYKHYESKEAIWNALLDKMEAYYREQFGSPEKLPEIPHSCKELSDIVMRMLRFTMHDRKVILTRRLLLTEQFHDDRVKKLATDHFLNSTKAIFAVIFEKMMENGLLKQNDPEMLAFIFTSPITSLIHYCDREPEKEPAIMRQIKVYVEHFIETYGIG